MQNVRRVTAHVLTGAPERLRDVRSGAAFDADAYSRMKHGDLDAIEALGGELARVLLADLPSLVSSPAAPVFPVAYLEVPPSCYFLADVVLRAVNERRHAAGTAPGRIVKVHKDSVTHTDYATATPEQRRAELSRIAFRLDEPIEGNAVVVVDDVRVTGHAEATILRALAGGRPASLVTAYVAVCDDDLARTPQVESALNQARVTSVLDLLPAIRAGRFVLTIRFLKRALASPDLARLVGECPRSVVEAMCAGAEATGPSFVTAYAEGMAVLEAALGGPGGPRDGGRGGPVGGISQVAHA
ncbi:phosphoribosyltransferase family protein [Leekyejoonella antrihumi]|nr:phosphoribosyltransferase family protein [Leekyejoonella antrihumi]